MNLDPAWFHQSRQGVESPGWELANFNVGSSKKSSILGTRS